MNFDIRILVAVAAAALVTGCGGMSSVTDTLGNVISGEESNAAAPTELQEFEPRISVEDLWSKRVGKGADDHYLKLTPLVLEGRLFVADRYGKLAATELESGKVLWEIKDKNLQYTGGPGGGDGLVLVGTGDARVIARESENGKLRWVARVSSEVLAAPRAADGVVVVRTADGKLYGLNAETGAELWIYDRTVPTLSLRGNAAPVIDDDLVLAGFDNGRLVALNLRNGKQAWESRLAIPSGRSDLERMVDVDGQPVVVGATVYVASFQGGVAAVSLLDGQIEWTREISSYAELGAGEDRVYVTDDTGSIWALDRHSGSSVWKQDGLGYRLPSGPRYFGGYVVVGDFEGYMHWLDAKTGEFAFRGKVDDDRIIAPAIPAGKVLLSYSAAGRLRAMRLQVTTLDNNAVALPLERHLKMNSSSGPAVKPTIAIIGRPNVGKSTLFNRLTRSRDALVADVPGLTRDPKVGVGRIGSAGYIVADTGGIDETATDELSTRVAELALEVARACEAVVMMVDGQAGLNASDEYLATQLRRAGVTGFLAVNKIEGRDAAMAGAEFAELGFDKVHAISATHGDGVTALIEAVTMGWAPLESYEYNAPGDRIRVAVMGRPNVGKSTLVNRLLGEERMITADIPGTTRDSIDSDFERDGRGYTVIDTAGLRRKSRVQGIAEKFSAIQTLQSLERCHVALLILDAQESVLEQDLSLLGLAIDSGRALVIAINKWDGLDLDQRERVKRDLDRRLRFVEFAECRYISALHGSGVGDLFPLIVDAWRSAFTAPKTKHLSTILERAVEAHEPPLVRGRRIKLRYAHLGGQNPPRIVLHGSQIDKLPGSYKRYLSNYFRESLNLVGTPVELEFRQGSNPFAGQRNKLNKRQIAKRRRLMAHNKRRR